jgi:hypothetical protein
MVKIMECKFTVFIGLKSFDIEGVSSINKCDCKRLEVVSYFI